MYQGRIRIQEIRYAKYLGTGFIHGFALIFVIDNHCVPESPKWSKMVLKLLVWIFMLSWMSIKHRQSKKKSNDRFLNKSTFYIYYC